MDMNYMNNNGLVCLDTEPLFTIDNRGFRYADGIFETMLQENGEIKCLHYHIERLQNGLRLLQFEDSALYDAFFVKSITDELVRKNNLVGNSVRIRLIVYRAGGGLYCPETNKSAYTLQVSNFRKPSYEFSKKGLIIGLYDEVKKPFSDLSHLKSLNSQVCVLGGIAQKKLRCDEVIILNQSGNICETLSSNVFISYQNKIYTPALSEGCVEGVMRRIVIEAARSIDVEIIEAEISPDILKVADEIFLTNAVKGVQWVMGFKQKRYFNLVSRRLQDAVTNRILSRSNDI